MHLVRPPQGPLIQCSMEDEAVVEVVAVDMAVAVISLMEEVVVAVVDVEGEVGTGETMVPIPIPLPGSQKIEIILMTNVTR